VAVAGLWLHYLLGIALAATTVIVLPALARAPRRLLAVSHKTLDAKQLVFKAMDHPDGGAPPPRPRRAPHRTRSWPRSWPNFSL
jgi:hypothetical protein